MEHICYIKQAIWRADLLGLSLNALCAEAGVARITLQRWLADKVSPTHSTFVKVKRAVDGVLEGQERALLAHLIALHPEHASSLIAGEDPPSTLVAGDTSPGGASPPGVSSSLLADARVRKTRGHFSSRIGDPKHPDGEVA